MLSRSLLTITVPFVFIGALQLVSCTPKEIAPAEPGGVYLSVSGGAQFDQSVDVVDENDQLIGYIDKLAVNNIHRPSHDTSTVYLTAGSGGVVRSVNDGESWQALNIPLTRVTAFVELSNGVWLASGTNENSEGVVIRSLDEGSSWDKVLTIPAAVKEEGGSFQIIKPPPPVAVFVATLVPDPFDETVVYATTSTGDVLAGQESGKVWQTLARVKASKTDPLTGRSNTAARRIVPSPHKQGELLIISGEGKLIRVNDVEQAEVSTPGGSVVDISFIKQFPDALLISVSSGVYVSRDNGEKWTELKLPISKAQPLTNVIVRVSPTNPNRLIVSVNNIIYRSEDGGESWNTLSLELPNHTITDISINPANAARVILTTLLTRT